MVTALPNDDRTIHAGFVANYRDVLGRPAWFLRGTHHNDAATLPDRISVADYIAVVGNIVTYGGNPAYHLDFLEAGLPPFRGALDTALRHAPDIASALMLQLAHQPARRPYYSLLVRTERDRIVVEYVAETDLGAARAPLVEVPLVDLGRLLVRCLGRGPQAARLEMRHAAPAYADRLAEIAGFPIDFGAPRDAISFPLAWANLPSICSDVKQWEAAVAECIAETATLTAPDLLQTLRGMIAGRLVAGDCPPRIDQAAATAGISTRTLIRRLRTAGSSYQTLVDDARKLRARELLARGTHTIADVAELLGYADPSSFRRSFRRWYGINPGARDTPSIR